MSFSDMIMMIFTIIKKIAASAWNAAIIVCVNALDLIELVLAFFALLVSNAAGSLACGLAGSLAFAASITVLADFSRSRDTKVLILFTWNSPFWDSFL